MICSVFRRYMEEIGLTTDLDLMKVYKGDSIGLASEEQIGLKPEAQKEDEVKTQEGEENDREIPGAFNIEDFLL